MKLKSIAFSATLLILVISFSVLAKNSKTGKINTVSAKTTSKASASLPESGIYFVDTLKNKKVYFAFAQTSKRIFVGIDQNGEESGYTAKDVSNFNGVIKLELAFNNIGSPAKQISVRIKQVSANKAIIELLDEKTSNSVEKVQSISPAFSLEIPVLSNPSCYYACDMGPEGGGSHTRCWICCFLFGC